MWVGSYLKPGGAGLRSGIGRLTSNLRFWLLVPWWRWLWLFQSRICQNVIESSGFICRFSYCDKRDQMNQIILHLADLSCHICHLLLLRQQHWKFGGVMTVWTDWVFYFVRHFLQSSRRKRARILEIFKFSLIPVLVSSYLLKLCFDAKEVITASHWVVAVVVILVFLRCWFRSW